jgi:hypothetical protein
LLWSSAVGLAVAAVAALVLTVFLPLEHQPSTDPRRAQATTAPSAAALPPLASFEKLWNQPLRQALGTAAPPSPMPAATIVTTPTSPDTGAGPPVSLIGTIGTSLAMLKTQANAVEVCAVGETFAGVTVLAVRTAEIDIRYMGRVMKLFKPAEAK